MNLEGIGQGSDPLSVQDYINDYCLHGTQKSRTQISIVQITNFPLKFMVRVIVIVVGLSSLHLAARTHMHIEVECMQGALFDWCLGLVPIMKKQ